MASMTLPLVVTEKLTELVKVFLSAVNHKILIKIQYGLLILPQLVKGF